MPIEAPARSDQTAQELEALIEEARRRARRRRFGYAAGAVTVLLAVGAALLLGGDEDADQTPDDGGRVRLGAAPATPDILFVRAVVDSREGVFEIDLTTGKIKRLRIPVNCGDAQFCLISTGGELVIGSVGRTTAYDPAASGRAQAAHLGGSWITVPSTNEGRVWLGILARGKLGGPQRRGLGSLREIDLDGNVVRSIRAPDGEFPVGTVASGLLFQYARSLRLWSLEERGFTLRIPGAFPVDTSASLVATCGDPCPTTLLTNTRTGESTRIAPPSGYRWIGGYEGAFSPSASQLALPVVRLRKDFRSSPELALIDTQTGDAHVIPGSAELDPAYREIEWSTDGDRLFFVAEDGTVMSYHVGSDSLAAHASFDPNDKIVQMVSVRPRD